MTWTFSGGVAYLTEVSNLPDIVIDGATLHMRGVNCGDITITDGELHAADVVCGDITMAADPSNKLHGQNVGCSDLILNGGESNQEARIDGLRCRGRLVSSSTFNLWSITSAVFSLLHPSSLSRVDISDLDKFTIGATILGADRHGLVLNACTVGQVYTHIVDPSQETDDTYDGISIQGASDQLDIRGSVRGAIDQANNPRYGADVAASATAIDLWLAISGAQTGDINDQTTGEVTIH